MTAPQERDYPAAVVVLSTLRKAPSDCVETRVLFGRLGRLGQRMWAVNTQIHMYIACRLVCVVHMVSGGVSFVGCINNIRVGRQQRMDT